MTRDSIKVGGAIVLVVALLVFLATCFERVPEREHVGLQGEARDNGFLAAERVLRRMGMPVTDLRGRFELAVLAQHDILVLPRYRPPMSPQKLRAVLDWVGAGGHLIVEAESARRPDPLLDELGIRRAGRVRSVPDFIIAPDAPETYRISFGSAPRLNPRKDLQALDWDGVLVYLERGRGRVSVINDLGFMRYRELGKQDHADYLWALLQATPGAHRLALLTRPGDLSALRWLAENAVATLISLAVLLVLWLWRIMPRFGPCAPEAAPARRRLLDHLRASGRYQWSLRASGRQLVHARESCLRNIARTHPGLVALPDAERDQQLAQYAGLAVDRVAHALTGQALHAHDFTDAVRTLQQLQEKLVRGW